MSVERGRQLHSGDRSPRSPIEERSMSRSTMVTDSDAPSHGMFIQFVNGVLKLTSISKTIRRAMAPKIKTKETDSRSRWHSLLYEAGGIGAAVSEESMRRLKFCCTVASGEGTNLFSGSLKFDAACIQYATGHIDEQILVLRNSSSR